MTTRKKKRGKRVLNDTHRAFITQQLATFSSPSETAAAVNEEFGLNVSRQAMERYDPNKHAGRRIAKRWRELFNITRAAFLDDVLTRIPEAHKSVRIQELAKASRVFKQRGNYIAQANLLEKIAREVGNVHSNRHEITGKDGGAIKFADVSEMTNEMLESEIDRLWAKAQGIEVTTPTKH